MQDARPAVVVAEADRLAVAAVGPQRRAELAQPGVDGALVDVQPIALVVGLQVISRVKVLAKMDIAERRMPQDGQIAIELEAGKRVHLRASTFPSSQGEKVVLRILSSQQIIAFESGADRVVDPLAGSYYVEHLTTELENRAMKLIERVDELGGSEQAIAAGFFQEEIARSAYEHQLRVEAGETVIVGVNRFADQEEALSIPAPDYSALEKAQVKSVKAVRKKRDASEVKRALAALTKASGASSTDKHLMPLIIDAVRARATVGEISSALAENWGYFRPSL